MTDILVTMQQDLERALKKPDKERRWAMLIDLRKCVGCHACTVACVSENKLPPKLYYRPVFEFERGTPPVRDGGGERFLPPQRLVGEEEGVQLGEAPAQLGAVEGGGSGHVGSAQVVEARRL